MTQGETLSSGVAIATKRARLTVTLLLTSVVLNAVGLVSSLAQLALLKGLAAGNTITEATANANDNRQTLIARIALALLVVTAIVYLMWFYQAYRNLLLVGTKASKHSAGSATGDWFIPFLNLVRPYNNMVELWQRSETQNAVDNVTGLRVPGIVGLWWFTWIAAAGLGRVAASQSELNVTVDRLINMTYLLVASIAVEIVAGLLAIRVVKAIDGYQQAFIQAPDGAVPASTS